MGLISRVSSRTYRKNTKTHTSPKMADRESRTIFARNISWNATVEDLFAIPAFANAADIKLPTDRETGRPRGFGFIEFNSPEECQQALQQAQNVTVDGREMILAQSQPRESQSGGRGGYGGNQGGYGGQQRGGYGGHQSGYGGQQQGGYGGQQQGGYGGQQGGYGGQGGY